MCCSTGSLCSPNSFLQICPLYCSKLCFNKCNWDFNPSWAGSSCNLAGVAISAAWSSLSGSSSLWQSKCGMDGRREGANRLVALSEIVKRGLVALWLWLMLKTSPSFPVSHHQSACWGFAGRKNRPHNNTNLDNNNNKRQCPLLDVAFVIFSMGTMNPSPDAILGPHITWPPVQEWKSSDFKQLSFGREETSGVFFCFFQTFNVLNSMW